MYEEFLFEVIENDSAVKRLLWVLRKLDDLNILKEENKITSEELLLITDSTSPKVLYL